jgi:hypothetical protein
MAIAVDAVTATASTASILTKTFAHTCSGSDRLLLVVAGCTTATADISGVTYNGVAMTQVGVDQTDSGGGGRMTVWALIAPATGANNVVITATATATIGYGAISFTGAYQTSNPDSNTQGAETATTSYSVTATAPTTNEAAVLFGYAMSGASLTGGTNTTIASQPEVTYHGTFIARTTNPQAASGSLTLNVTSANQTFKGLIVTIAPAATGKTISVSDTFTLSESNSNLRARLITISDTITLSNVVTAAKATLLSVSDTIGLSEAITSLRGLKIAISETLNLAEAVSSLRARLLSVADTITASEAITAAKAVFISVSDTIGLSEARNIIRGLISRVSDFLGLSDVFIDRTAPDTNYLRVSIELTDDYRPTIEMSEAKITIELKGGSQNVNL